MRWRGLLLCSYFNAASSLLPKFPLSILTDCVPSKSSKRWATSSLLLSNRDLVVDDDEDVTDDDGDDGTTSNQLIALDRRPHEQRANGPRTARRLNHAFKYLYRHISSQDLEERLANMTTRQFLQEYGGFSNDDVDEMSRDFPPLLDLDVRRHLRPKLRFLQETLLRNGQVISIGSDERDHALMALPQDVRRRIPPHFFGARLERLLAPRHAFLVYMNLPHGPQLLSEPDQNNQRSTLWQDFLLSCRHPKRYAALCNRWRQHQRKAQSQRQSNYNSNENQFLITSKQIEAFDALFSRGLMAAARNELRQANNEWPLKYVNMTSSELISLMIQHGANPMERDIRGVSLLHWAAGTGNLAAVQVLLPFFSPKGVFTEAERDGALPLHWAAAGAKTREFGCGGHPEVCQFLLEQQQKIADESGVDTLKTLVNAITKDGNSALMWAAWSGTLETVKLLIRNRADATVRNRNGCTVAHWAASGGNVAVCQYLADICCVDFTTPNHGGNTPLTHAIAFGRVEVVSWLRRKGIGDTVETDRSAIHLAQDFVMWTDGEEKRKQVLDLMADWLGMSDDGEGSDRMTPYDDDDAAIASMEMY